MPKLSTSKLVLFTVLSTWLVFSFSTAEAAPSGGGTVVEITSTQTCLKIEANEIKIAKQEFKRKFPKLFEKYCLVNIDSLDHRVVLTFGSEPKSSEKNPMFIVSIDENTKTVKSNFLRTLGCGCFKP